MIRHLWDEIALAILHPHNYPEDHISVALGRDEVRGLEIDAGRRPVGQVRSTAFNRGLKSWNRCDRALSYLKRVAAQRIERACTPTRVGTAQLFSGGALRVTQELAVEANVHRIRWSWHQTIVINASCKSQVVSNSRPGEVGA